MRGPWLIIFALVFLFGNANVVLIEEADAFPLGQETATFTIRETRSIQLARTPSLSFRKVPRQAFRAEPFFRKGLPLYPTHVPIPIRV